MILVDEFIKMQVTDNPEAFKEMFDTAGASLPIVTQICIDMGEFLKAQW